MPPRRARRRLPAPARDPVPPSASVLTGYCQIQCALRLSTADPRDNVAGILGDQSWLRSRIAVDQRLCTPRAIGRVCGGSPNRAHPVRSRAFSIRFARHCACATTAADRRSLCHVDRAVHRVSRQAPFRRDERCRSHGVPDLVGRRPEGGGVQAEKSTLMTESTVDPQPTERDASLDQLVAKHRLQCWVERHALERWLARLTPFRSFTVCVGRFFR